MPSEDTSLAEDLLPGAEKIAAFVGIDIRTCFYYLTTGLLPAKKLGRKWLGSKSRLRKHLTEDLYTPPPKKEPSPIKRRKHKAA
jgi:hypothetical protein